MNEDNVRNGKIVVICLNTVVFIIGLAAFSCSLASLQADLFYVSLWFRQLHYVWDVSCVAITASLLLCLISALICTILEKVLASRGLLLLHSVSVTLLALFVVAVGIALVVETRTNQPDLREITKITCINRYVHTHHKMLANNRILNKTVELYYEDVGCNNYPNPKHRRDCDDMYTDFHTVCGILLIVSSVVLIPSVLFSVKLLRRRNEDLLIEYLDANQTMEEANLDIEYYQQPIQADSPRGSVAS